MVDFSMTPIIGGALIGTAATILLLFHGKVAGISGIFGGVLSGEALTWRSPFLIGLISAGLFVILAGKSVGLNETIVDNAFANTAPRNMISVAIAGLLVGFGTRLGNGCTSGHGICGLGRASKRSIAATMTFMATGALAAYITQHLIHSFIQG